jgi:hypothetical protein
MTIDDIRQRVFTLRDEINALTTMLPDEVQITFGTVYQTGPSVPGQRKRLAVSFRESRDTDDDSKSGPDESS